MMRHYQKCISTLKKKANFKPLSAPFQFSQFVFEQQKTGEARQLYSIKILSKGAASYSTYTQHTSALFDLQQSNAAQQLSDYSRIYLNWPFLQV